MGADHSHGRARAGAGVSAWCGRAVRDTRHQGRARLRSTPHPTPEQGSASRAPVLSRERHSATHPPGAFMSCCISAWESKSSQLGHPGHGSRASKLCREAREKQCQILPEEARWAGQHSAGTGRASCRSAGTGASHRTTQPGAGVQSPGSGAAARGTPAIPGRHWKAALDRVGKGRAEQRAGKLPAPQRGV